MGVKQNMVFYYILSHVTAPHNYSTERNNLSPQKYEYAGPDLPTCGS